MSDMPARLNAPEQQTLAMPLLSVEGISVRFAGIKALTDVSFQVMPGAWNCSIIGLP